MLPTQEYQNGQYVTVTAPFRVYHNVAQSIADHGQLLATSSSYQHAMADRHLPDAFATDLTGVYATDPHYGSNLIAIMKLYNLYRYSAPDAQQAAPAHARRRLPRPRIPHAAQVPDRAGWTAGAGRRISTARARRGTFGLGGVVNLNGQASQGGSDGQGRSASQQLSPQACHPARIGQPGRLGQPGRAASQRSVVWHGGATIPGVLDAYVRPRRTVRRQRGRYRTGRCWPDRVWPGPGRRGGVPRARRPGGATRPRAIRYVPKIPQTVTTAFVTTAKAPLSRAEPLYDEVASHTGIRWELLAACDWMQCQARPRYSPVYGEKLGTVNAGGTVYRTKSEALGQCASDLIELAMAVYWIDITARRPLSVRDLANVFAAFRWGGLLKLHGVSAMEFPYSVAGLTDQHVKMRWPDIKEPNAPDKPGTRFRTAFGAVPAVLCLGYPAIA